MWRDPADGIMPVEPEKATQGLTQVTDAAAEAAFQFQTGVSNPWLIGASPTFGTAEARENAISPRGEE
jgi:hypothetical protein